jgi:hypothetical protein
MKPDSLLLKFCILILFVSLSSCKKKDIPPSVKNQVFTIEENSPAGSFVGKVVANDEDGQISSYSILSGNADNAFIISTTDGKLTVSNVAAINYETHPAFSLLVEVKDDKNKNSTAEILINVKRDIPPLIINQEFSIKEKSPSGSLVGQIVATDGDGQISSFSILSGNLDNAFSISETDGKLTVNNEAVIDYEIHPTFTLLVKVTDNQNKSTTANIKVNLIDVAPPVSGLILYYPFNGNLKDSSGNHNDGIDYTSDHFVGGVRSQALDFNGTSDYIKLSSSLNIQNGLSFSFWINTRGTNGTENNGNIISKYTMAGTERGLLINSFGYQSTKYENRIGVAYYANGSSSNYDFVNSYMEPGDLTNYPNPELWTLSNPLKLIMGYWTHCVVNVTPTKVEIWFNGILCTSKTREYSAYYNSPTEPTYIGNIIYGGEGNNNHFNGLLDELRIYNRALTNEEIQILHKE